MCYFSRDQKDPVAFKNEWNYNISISRHKEVSIHLTVAAVHSARKIGMLISEHGLFGVLTAVNK